MKFIWFSCVIAVYACAVVGRNVVDTKSRVDERIVNGEDARIEDYPYQVFTYVKSIPEHPSYCGGSILSPRVIITAAHCTVPFNENDLLVYAGSTNRRNASVKREVSKIINHKNYSNTTYDSDISLLILTEPLNFSKTIQPIGLPENGEDLRTGELAVSTGWGALYKYGPSSDVLQKVELPIVDQKKCIADYKDLLLPNGDLYPPVTPRMLCAGESVQNAGSGCNGDSGGPLALNGKLYGITSWGDACGRRGYPTVFTRVTAVLPWIQSKLNLYK